MELKGRTALVTGAGTRVGRVIALALVSGLRAYIVNEMIIAVIPSVFGSDNLASNTLSEWWKAKYLPLGLENELRALFGDNTLASLSRDVCITSATFSTAKPSFHKTAYFQRNATRTNETLAMSRWRQPQPRRMPRAFDHPHR